ncbi:MAG: hypothetical protein QXH07_02035 [Thermoplasmata archaeon]
MSLKNDILDGKLSSGRCRGFARHKKLLNFVSYLIKKDKIDMETAKAIEKEIYLHGEKSTWLEIFDYSIKGKELFKEV